MTKNSKIESFLDRCLDSNTNNFLLKLSSLLQVSRNETEFVNIILNIEKRISTIELQQSSDMESILNKLDNLKSEVCRLLESNFYKKVIKKKQEVNSSRIEGIDNIVLQNSQSALVGQKIFVEPVTGMEFVFVPGGTFEMGNVFGQGHQNELPTHSVTLNDFWIAKFPVTQSQWVKIMKKNPSVFKTNKNKPVENVSWDMVIDFTDRLNKIHKPDQDDFKFRLPTEEEWEYAARSGGKFQIYAGGDHLDSLGWYYENCKSTMPVGQKQSNDLGIYDMSGNVSEWTSDVYDDNSYYNKSISNFELSKKFQTKTIRGGNWMSSKNYCRTMFRTGKMSNLRFNNIGFRVVYG